MWGPIDPSEGGMLIYLKHGKLLEQCGLAPVMKTIRTRLADVSVLLFMGQ